MFSISGDVPGFDACAGGDPVIGSIYDTFEIFVGHDSLRKIASCASDGHGDLRSICAHWNGLLACWVTVVNSFYKVCKIK